MTRRPSKPESGRGGRDQGGPRGPRGNDERRGGRRDQRRERRTEGNAEERVVIGTRAVAELLRVNASVIQLLLVADGHEAPLAAILTEARERGVRIEVRPRAELDRWGGERHQGVVALRGEFVYSTLDAILASAGPKPLLVALDSITDPHNLGAIIRSAVAFGADGVLIPQDRAAPVTAVAVRASAGATEHAKIAMVVNLSRALATLRDDHGLSVVGLAAEGTADVASLPPADLGRVLVVGSEGKGLRRLVAEQCDVLAKISMAGPIASLNASVAAGIALAYASQQR